MKKLTGVFIVLFLGGFLLHGIAQIQPKSYFPWETFIQPVRPVAVAVEVTPCYINKVTHLGGATLRVYNPYEKNPDYFGAEIFIVNWYQDGRPLGSTYRIDRCICGSPVEVIVTDLRNLRSYRAEGVVPLCDLLQGNE